VFYLCDIFWECNPGVKDDLPVSSNKWISKWVQCWVHRF